MVIKNAPSEFIGDEDIFSGATTFTDATLIPNDYEWGGIQDISILPTLAKQ